VFERTQGFPLSLHYRFLRSQPTIAFGIQQQLVKQIATLRPQFQEKGSCFLLSALPPHFEVWWSITTHLIHEVAWLTFSVP